MDIDDIVNILNAPPPKILNHPSRLHQLELETEVQEQQYTIESMLIDELSERLMEDEKFRQQRLDEIKEPSVHRPDMTKEQWEALLREEDFWESVQEIDDPRMQMWVILEHNDEDAALLFGPGGMCETLIFCFGGITPRPPGLPSLAFPRPPVFLPPPEPVPTDQY